MHQYCCCYWRYVPLTACCRIPLPNVAFRLSPTAGERKGAKHKLGPTWHFSNAGVLCLPGGRLDTQPTRAVLDLTAPITGIP